MSPQKRSNLRLVLLELCGRLAQTHIKRSKKRTPSIILVIARFPLSIRIVQGMAKRVETQEIAPVRSVSQPSRLPSSTKPEECPPTAIPSNLLDSDSDSGLEESQDSLRKTTELGDADELESSIGGTVQNGEKGSSLRRISVIDKRQASQNVSSCCRVRMWHVITVVVILVITNCSIT